MQSLDVDKIVTADTQFNPSKVGGPWKESLFGCFSDLTTCCYGCCCPPCSFGTNAKKIDGSSCVGMCALYWILAHCYLCWVPHLKKRKILRQKYGLREDPCNDCLVTGFCGPCGLCQEAREIKAREGPRVGPNVRAIRSQPQVAYRK